MHCLVVGPSLFVSSKEEPGCCMVITCLVTGLALMVEQMGPSDVENTVLSCKQT